MTTELPALDIDRLLTTLDRYEGRLRARWRRRCDRVRCSPADGDLDCVARRSSDNLDRLAAALRSLNARLRVHDHTDEEAALLPTHIDKDTLGRLEISTWRTDAGDFDVLTDLPGQTRLVLPA